MDDSSCLGLHRLQEMDFEVLIMESLSDILEGFRVQDMCGVPREGILLHVVANMANGGWRKSCALGSTRYVEYGPKYTIIPII